MADRTRVPDEACYMIDVDGEPVVVRASEPMNAEAQEAFVHIVRAARKHLQDEQQPTPPEWKAWEEGTGRCPYCVDHCACSWWAICDCFMAPEPEQYPCFQDDCWGLDDG